MSKRRFMARKSALASVFVCGVIAAAAVAGDLSKYGVSNLEPICRRWPRRSERVCRRRKFFIAASR